MDKVRDNINQFIESIQAEYRFQGKKILEVGVGLLDHNKQLFSGNDYLASDVYETPHTNIILDITKPETFDAIFESTFDLVIVSEVLEHVYEHRKAFEALQKIVKPEGYVLITVPFEYQEHGEDYWRYTGRTLDRLLSEYGFQTIVSREGFDGDRKTNIFRLAQYSGNIK